MRNRIVPAIAAASIITLGATVAGTAPGFAQQEGATGQTVATAEPAPPGQAGPETHEMGGGWEHHREMMRRMMMRGMGERLAAPGTFGLFPPNQDKQLAPADVQEIAQAILLWHGNHSWKVVEVHEAAAGKVAFAYAMPDNSVIARFEMDRRTGRITRTG